jgi:hypothetical protein
MRKIYVAGSRGYNGFGSPCCGYSNWLNPDSFTGKIEQSTLVLGLGGSDVSSFYYNQQNSGRLYCDPETDKLEYEDFRKAIALGKKVIGICKSAQWGAAMAGGAIYQDVHHPWQHELTTFDGHKILCNSGHHNMQDVSNLKENNDYKLLAWTNSLSPYHINGDNENVPCEREAEVVFYPKINWLSFQNHNESIYDNPMFSPMIKWSQEIVKRFLAGQL